VKAVGESTATLEITACPTPAGIEQLKDIISLLSSSGVLVAGSNGGNSHLTINICPEGISK